ncbi:hypothetical protein [Luteolibacter sp. Populi]|uniref:hypothetical protein n=1 Tax=Luteolibacter sp. Populi TaxID=3230487 RepID=UPI003466110C
MSAPQGPNDNSDPIRPWFRALKELGDCIEIRFGQIKPGTSEPEWHFLEHTDYDGIGGLAKLLRERGGEVGDLPMITHPAPLNWWSFLKVVPAMMGPRRRLQWKPMPEGPPPPPPNQPPAAVAWHVFSEEETLKIRQSARNAMVTVNTMLLKYLDRSVRPFLMDPSNAVPWMIPVNLRGKVEQPADTENHSTYIGIRIFASEGMQEVHRQIYENLESGQHCGHWMAFTASKFSSPALKKKLILADRATTQWNLGGFSNLGVWDPDKRIDAADCQGDWLFAPPVLESQMIGAGCVTFQGRLSLTLHVHPNLTTAREVPEEFMNRWVREVELGFPV